MFRHRMFLAIICGAWAQLSSAHELWIDAETWQVPPGATISANLRNGENFVGSTLAWLDKNVARAEIAFSDDIVAYAGRLGDRPALVMDARGQGLAVLLHETTPARLTYKEWKKFAAFVAHKDLGITKDGHLAAGHPETGFVETYTRHVKALVAVGHGAGSDRAFGLETEFVAQANPYDAAFDGMLPVQLLYQGAPRGDVQVEIFDRAPDGTVSVRLARTDADGTARIAVDRGHTYLLDSVVLRASAEDRAIYHTLWAGLTFFVP